MGRIKIEDFSSDKTVTGYYKIYLIINIINNKIYIGQTCQPISTRWSAHKYAAKTGNNSHFYKAIRKYGADSFRLEQLDCTDDEHYVNWLESFYVGVTQSYKPEIGYNATMGGEGGIQTEETRMKISNSQTGQNNSMFGRRGKNSPLYGKKRPPEVGQKISTSKIQKFQDPKEKNKHLESHINFKPPVREDIINEEIAKLYEEGWSTRKIAKQFNTHNSLIARRLHIFGVKLRPQSQVAGRREGH